MLVGLYYNAKITEIEVKILSITGSATTAAPNTVENKKPNPSNLVKKKKDYDANISDIESKYFLICGYDKFTNEITSNKIKENKLVNNSNISEFIDNLNLDKKIQD